MNTAVIIGQGPEVAALLKRSGRLFYELRIAGLKWVSRFNEDVIDHQVCSFRFPLERTNLTF